MDSGPFIGQAVRRAAHQLRQLGELFDHCTVVADKQDGPSLQIDHILAEHFAVCHVRELLQLVQNELHVFL